MDNVVVYAAMWNAVGKHKNVWKLLRWKWHIVHRQLNLNVYSNQECLEKFCYEREYIGIIVFLCSFYGLTSGTMYDCNEVTATCIMLQSMACMTSWKDLEMKFGMFHL